MIMTFCLIGALAMALIALVIGAFFSGANQTRKRFEKDLADEESKKLQNILSSQVNSMPLSDPDIADKLSKHNGVKLTVYPGGRKDQP